VKISAKTEQRRRCSAPADHSTENGEGNVNYFATGEAPDNYGPY
jgi:hypothetical protein